MVDIKKGKKDRGNERKKGENTKEKWENTDYVRKRVRELEDIILRRKNAYPVEDFIRKKKDGRSKPNIVDIVVKTILSQNTSDDLRDRAFLNLKMKYGDLMKVLDAPSEQVEELIRVCGLPRVKLRRIKNALSTIKRSFKNPNDICKLGKNEAFSFLSSIKGIGPKSAEVILAFGCGFDTFPVDTHIARIIRRIGIADGTREKIYQLVSPYFREKIFSHVFLIHHGRAVCKARNPDCENCFFLKICDYGKSQKND